MDLWNIKDLAPPPVGTCTIATKEVDVRLLVAVLTEAVDFFENQDHLSAEAAFLSRSVYRSKMKFRSSKDFKFAEKLSHVLRTYQQMNVSTMLKMLVNSICLNHSLNMRYMPTKNMLDYALVRLQGLGKLFSKVLEICKVVSGWMQQRLRLGHFWRIAIVFFASAARVFVASKRMLRYCCKLYGNLLPYSSILGNCGVRWLPAGYVFPGQLDVWLHIDWLDFENNVIEIADDEPILSYLKLTDSDDEVEFCDEYILVKDESMVGETVDVCEDSAIRLDTDVEVLDEEECVKIEDEDVGEVINISGTEGTEAQRTSGRKRRRKTCRKMEKFDTSDFLTLHSEGNAVEKNNTNVGVMVNVETKTSKKRRRKRASKNLVQNETHGCEIRLEQKKRKNRTNAPGQNNNKLKKPSSTVIPQSESNIKPKKKKLKRYFDGLQ